MIESLSNEAEDFKPCNVVKKRLQHRCFPLNIAKSLRTSILKIICKRLLQPPEVFCIRNLLILAMKLLHLAYKKTIWLQLIYFLSTIRFWPVKYLLRILGVVFIAQISRYEEFFFCLFCNWRIKLSKNLSRNHAVPGLFS